MEQPMHAFRLWRENRMEGLITLASIAQQVGVSASHLSEIERGRDVPSLALAAKLSALTRDESGAPRVPIEAFIRPESPKPDPYFLAAAPPGERPEEGDDDPVSDTEAA